VLIRLVALLLENQEKSSGLNNVSCEWSLINAALSTCSSVLPMISLLSSIADCSFVIVIAVGLVKAAVDACVVAADNDKRVHVSGVAGFGQTRTKMSGDWRLDRLRQFLM
jgi:hypothetical protein